MKRLARKILLFIIPSLAGAAVVLLAVAVYFLNKQPDLKVWHTASLDEEFSAESPIASFSQYRALEARLFRELDEEIYNRIGRNDRFPVNRYNRGSLSDPGRWQVNWNRSYELPVERPRAGVLLLHGLSDAPYSLRSIGKRLHGARAWVVGLRLPGHGTAPAALTRATWRDMAAAVRLGMDHLRAKIGDKPIYMVGYSTGATLAIHYSLENLSGSGRPAAERLVLISPAVGVTPAAALAVWQARLGHLLGLEKLEWHVVNPEYDPFKYKSFPINASNQIYRLTQVVQSRLDGLDETALRRFPSTLAFQSATDATVMARDVIDKFFSRLPDGGHEVVMFDINRSRTLEFLLAGDPGPWLQSLLAEDALPFSLSLLTSPEPDSQEIVVKYKPAGATAPETIPTRMRWPDDVYAISHIALPISPRDPLYGTGEASGATALQLGNLALRGERDVLRLSGTDMLRLSWNPFYDYVEERILKFLHLQEAAGPAGP